MFLPHTIVKLNYILKIYYNSLYIVNLHLILFRKQKRKRYFVFNKKKKIILYSKYIINIKSILYLFKMNTLYNK